MEKYENMSFLREELENAKRALFTARSIREMKCLQHRIKFLREKMRELSKSKA